ncbi:hypothetical protein DPMN_056563 [Dreissena polymorpha]|uniref:Uncharacterized protein n=1 Tax=Dreissena polymorpha TaxID=45954 RepID=A0A9D4HV63_DREPO|nr:hypothetical protein DPMN_056563 [Dreissena polymorpha]
MDWLLDGSLCPMISLANTRLSSIGCANVTSASLPVFNNRHWMAGIQATERHSTAVTMTPKLVESPTVPTS